MTKFHAVITLNSQNMSVSPFFNTAAEVQSYLDNNNKNCDAIIEVSNWKEIEAIQTIRTGYLNGHFGKTSAINYLRQTKMETATAIRIVNNWRV